MAKQYRAFISYAHHDERWASWLQRSLERYRVPAKLRQQLAGERSIPSRLHPIFRDRDELASSADLSESICSAMDRSSALIVVCSPTAAASKWVQEEIRYFQAKGRADQIFCLLVSGAPERDHPDCAFPKALLETDAGQPLPDPLAADISEHADGKRDAMLKIAAGLLGVGIDDLKQRDAQRRLRLRTAISAASLAIMVVTVGLAISAYLARAESEVRRAQAERLISFMLGDLRSKLEPVGRLDVLDAVGDEAMDYFAAVGERGTANEVFARAMAVRQIGEVRFRQGRLSEAQEAFEESRDVAEALYASEPENNRYLFELGQAEFWVGYATLEQSLLEQTHASFIKYMEYSQQLLSREPDNPDYQLELSYAYSNLGTLLLENRNPQAALEYFQKSVALDEGQVAVDPENLYLKHQAGNGYSWVGATLLELGRLQDSKAAYTAAVERLSELHDTGKSRLYSEHYGQNAYHLGNVHLHQGELAAAETLFSRALEVFNELEAFDPENSIWHNCRGISAYHLAELYLLTGRKDAAAELLGLAISDFTALVAIDPGDFRIVEKLALAERLMALFILDDSIDRALELSSRAQSRVEDILSQDAVKARTVLTAGIVAEAHGRVLLEAGDEAAARSTFNQALELLTSQNQSGLAEVAVERQIISHLNGGDAALPLAAKLEEAGFVDPRFN